MKERFLLFQTPEEQKLEIVKIDKELKSYPRILSQMRHNLEKKEKDFTYLKDFRHTLKVQLIILSKQSSASPILLKHQRGFILIIGLSVAVLIMN